MTYTLNGQQLLELTEELAAKMYEGTMWDAGDIIAEPFPEAPEKSKAFYRRRAHDAITLLWPQLAGRILGLAIEDIRGHHEEADNVFFIEGVESAIHCLMGLQEEMQEQ